jgi:beta-glucosidase
MDGTDEELEQAVAIARAADLAILVVGERGGLVEDCQSGEARDRMDIGLPGRQSELVAAVAATGTPVVLVLVAGRPLAIPREADMSAAVLHAWFPGDEGGVAIADILFGDAEPTGRLPVTVPWSVGQVPTYYGHRPSSGHSNWKGPYVDGPNLPLWPFGYGLTYTSFRLGEPRLDTATIGPTGSVTLRVDVTNTGSRSGTEVVQLYLRDVEASVTRPVRQLCGFARVELLPGQTRTVAFEVFADQLAFTGVDGRLRVEPGRIDLMLGRSSADIDHTVSVEVTGDVRVLEQRERFLSDVTLGSVSDAGGHRA